MQKSLEQIRAYNNETDFSELIRSIWKGKWLVIGVALATLSFGIAYLLLFPKTYTGTLEIWPLPLAKAEVYSELNETEFMPVIDEKRLLINFLDDVKSHTALENAIKASNYATQLEDETDREFAFRVRAAANNFTIVPALENKKNSSTILKFTTQKPKLALDVVSEALVESNQNVNKNLVESFERRRNEYLRWVSYAMADFETSKKLAIVTYKTSVQARLARLNEQAKIARSINLAKGSVSSVPNKNTSSVYLPVPLNERDIEYAMDTAYFGSGAKEDEMGSYLLSQDINESPLYLRGFLAIEEEIKTLQARNSPENFIPSLGRIERDIFKLSQDQTIYRVEQGLAITPIGTGQFDAAVYDIASLEYKSDTKSSIILALSIVLGGMLGIFVLLIRNVLINND